MVTHHPNSTRNIDTSDLKFASSLKSQDYDQLPKDGHLSALGWSPIIYYMVTQLPKDCHSASKEWSPTISCMITHHKKLFKSYKTLRNSNQTWSFTLAQPSLSSFFLSFCNQISSLLIAFQQCVGTPIIHYLVTSNTRAWLNNATLITFRLAKQCHTHMIIFLKKKTTQKLMTNSKKFLVLKTEKNLKNKNFHQKEDNLRN